MAVLVVLAGCAADGPKRHVREHAGGTAEGALGTMQAPTHSRFYDYLVTRGIHADTLQQSTRHERDEIMKTFAWSLGVQCTFCHDEEDFDHMTPRLRVAVDMWMVFTRRFRLRGGAPLYCDSCHHGHATFLPRDGAHHASVETVMHAYVSQLETREGGPVRCESCHGTPFNPRFLVRL